MHGGDRRIELIGQYRVLWQLLLPVQLLLLLLLGTEEQSAY